MKRSHNDPEFVVKKRRRVSPEPTSEASQESPISRSRRRRGSSLPPPSKDPAVPQNDDQRRRRESSEPPPLLSPRPAPQRPNFDPFDYFTLVTKETKTWRKGPVVQVSHALKMIKPLPPAHPLERQIQVLALLESAFKKLLASAPPMAKAQVVVENESFNLGTVTTCVHNASDLTFYHLADRITAALGSDESIDLTKSTFTVLMFTPGVAGARSNPQHVGNRTIVDQSEFLKKKKASTYDPTAALNTVRTTSKFSKQREGLCVPLIIARELHAMDPNRGPGRLRNYLATKDALAKAQEMVAELGLQPATGPFPLDQLHKFADCLPDDCSLRFFDTAAAPIISVEKPGDRAVNIAIAYSGQGSLYHAHGITSLTGWFGSRKICQNCWKKDYTKSRQAVHKCGESRCTLCKHPGCKNTEKIRRWAEARPCHFCEVFFSTQECVKAHLCETNRCGRCHLTIKTKKSHKCGVVSCSRCLTTHSPLLQCYVKPDKPKMENTRKKIWYADAESQIDASGQHHANYVFVQRRDGRDFKEYRGDEAMLKFTEDCIKSDSPYKDSYIVWHNASNYDAHLWWKELIKLKTPPKSIIRRGQRILTMDLAQNGITCRDSLQFIPGTPLAAFPKMFGLTTGSKGRFPHGLNTPEWIKFQPGEKTVYKEVVDGVEHRFPRLEHFWPGGCRPDDLRELKKWHQEQVQRFQDDPSLCYYPEQELVMYCRQDVRILRQGFELYRKNWLDQYNQDPLDYSTFPSFNNSLLRNHYIPEDSIGIIPGQGYEPGNRPVSDDHMAWLAWLEHKEGLTSMRNGRKGGEVRLTRWSLDGVAMKDGVIQALNYHGCFAHGHSKQLCCHKDSATWSDAIRTANFKRNELVDRDLKELETSQLYGPLKYRVVYECEFNRAKEEDPELAAFVEEYTKRYQEAGEPLRPRDALRGGRTNAIKFNVGDIPIDFILAYFDVTSLYPSVNASVNGERWPLGHPDIYIGKDVDNCPNDWFGLAKIEMAPPRRLRHPVIGQPFKSGRVLFHLCTACAEKGEGGECKHTDEERTIKGTFFTGEVDEAVKKGYKITKVHEVWHWPPERTTTDLFRPMICDQFKKKVIASPKPSDPSGLLADLALLGITIGEGEWDENKAMRALAKFSLNNIWGFLGSDTRYEHTEVVTSMARLHAIERDPDIELTKIEISDDEESLFVVYKPKREVLGRKHSVVLAALTTAYARIALYKLIDEYSDEVVYFDTDSVFLLLPKGRPPPQTSTKLGGLKDEIFEEFGEGARITKFSSLGPKCYAYTVEKDGVVLKEEVKVKGIRLVGEAAEELSAERLHQMAQDPHSLITLPQSLIKRDLFKLSLRSVDLMKRVRFCCSKRYLKPGHNPMFDTLPFGY